MISGTRVIGPVIIFPLPRVEPGANKRDGDIVADQRSRTGYIGAFWSGRSSTNQRCSPIDGTLRQQDESLQ